MQMVSTSGAVDRTGTGAGAPLGVIEPERTLTDAQASGNTSL